MKTISHFKLQNTIDNNGATCKVKLAVDSRSKKTVALKVLKTDLSKSMRESYEVEVNSLAKLDHANVIKMIDHDTAEYKGKQTDFVALELAQSDFWELQNIDGKFTEKSARYFFKQLIAGLEHCHNNGIAHRDIKPQNLLLGADLNLKLSDFGFAYELSEGEQCTQFLGTDGFMSPQILSRSDAYSPVSADIFAAGVCLFAWVVGHMPFKHADKSDPYYKCISKKRLDIFWKCHDRRLQEKGKKPVSAELKELLGAIFQKDESDRISIQQVLDSKWMQEQTPSTEQIEAELESRLWLLESEKSKKVEQKKKEKKIAMERKESEANADTADTTGDEELSKDASEKSSNSEVEEVVSKTENDAATNKTLIVSLLSAFFSMAVIS